jgi:hypothetical protein
MNYEIMWQAKIILTPIPIVFHSPMPHHSQANYGFCKNRAIIKPPSNQFLQCTPTTHTQEFLLYISKTVQPSIRALGSLQTASINKFDIPGLQPHSNADP